MTLGDRRKIEKWWKRKNMTRYFESLQLIHTWWYSAKLEVDQKLIHTLYGILQYLFKMNVTINMHGVFEFYQWLLSYLWTADITNVLFGFRKLHSDLKENSVFFFCKTDNLMLKLKILWAWDFDILHGIQKTDSCNSSRVLIFNKISLYSV